MANYQTAVHLWQDPKYKTWYLRWQEDGEPQRKAIGTKERKEAEKVLAEVLGASGSFKKPKLQLTLHAALDAWLRDRSRPLRGLATITLKEYKTFITQLKSLVPAGVVAGDMQASDIRELLDQFQVEFGLSPSTVKKRYGALKMVFAWMVEEDIVLKSPVKKGDVPFAEAQQKPPWSREDYIRLLLAIRSEIQHPSATEASMVNHQALFDLVRMVWFSGMRSIQAYRLAWTDVDIGKMVWVLRSPRKNKGGVSAQPIHRKLKGMLLRRASMYGIEWGGRVLPPQERMTTVWTRFKKAHPLHEGWSLHQARARVVTDLKRMGEEQASMDLVGHTREETSDLYTHLGAEDHRAALDRL